MNAKLKTQSGLPVVNAEIDGIVIDAEMALRIQIAIKDSIIKTEAQTQTIQDPKKIESNNWWVESLATIYNHLEEQISN